MFLLLVSSTFAQTWPADANIDDALHLQMTPQGLAATADIATEVVPTDPFPIPVISGGTLGAGLPGCLVDYGYDVSNGSVEAEVLTASIVPSNGVLTLQAEIQVTVNRINDPMVMELGAACIEGDCDAWIEPFIVDLTAPITLGVSNGEIHATIGTVTTTDTLTGSHVMVTNCTAASIVDAVNSVFNVYDLLVDYARDQVVDLIPGFVADFQTALDDALSVTQFSTEVDLLGTTLFVDFAAIDIEVTTAGLDAQVGGHVFAEAHPCIAAYDQGGSRQSAGAVPGVNTLPAATHVGIPISSDIVDQGLYAIWRGGLLCYEQEGGDLAGFALDTGLLTLLGGPSFAVLLPEIKPLTVKTAPTLPPLTVASPDHDLAVAVDHLGVDFFAELDGRQAHVFGIDISPEVGLDVTFSNTFGTLEVDLALPEAYNGVLRGDPMVPDAVEIVTNVENIVGTLAETAITGALGDALSFEIPTYDAPSGQNFGLRDLTVTGVSGGWTTAEAQIGTVTYNGSLGCSQGCTGSTGCATPGTTLSWAGFLLALVGLRRRTTAADQRRE